MGHLNDLFENNAIEELNIQLTKSHLKGSSPMSLDDLMSHMATTLDVENGLVIYSNSIRSNNLSEKTNLSFLKLMACIDEKYSLLKSKELTSNSFSYFQHMTWLLDLNQRHDDAIDLYLAGAISNIGKNEEIASYCLSKLVRFKNFRLKTSSNTLKEKILLGKFSSLDTLVRGINYLVWHEFYAEAKFLISRCKNSLSENINNYLANCFNPVLYGSLNHETNEDWIHVKNMDGNSKENLEIVTVVWGESFCKLLNKISIKSVTQSNDWPDLLKKYNVIWSFYTTEDSLGFFQQSLVDLKKHNLTIRLNKNLLGKNKDGLQNRGRAVYDAMVRSSRNKTKFFLITPDALWGDGVYKLVEKCSFGEVSGLSCLRALENPVYQAFDSGLIDEIFSGPHKNSKLVALAITDWSHFYTRKTYLNTKFIHAERTLKYIKPGRIEVRNAGKCAYVLNLNVKQVDQLSKDAAWLYGNFHDKYLNSLDHYLSWEYSDTNQFKCVTDTNEAFFLDLVSNKSFLNAAKGMTGFPLHIYLAAQREPQYYEYSSAIEWLSSRNIYNNGYDYRKFLYSGY